MVLKNASIAVIEPRKFTNYCLDPNNEDGRHKAVVFKTALGFDISNYAELIKAIRDGILDNDAVYVEERPHGHIWQVDMEITGPAGTATVRTGWIYEKGRDVPRLTTAYVR